MLRTSRMALSATLLPSMLLTASICESRVREVGDRIIAKIEPALIEPMRIEPVMTNPAPIDPVAPALIEPVPIEATTGSATGSAIHRPAIDPDLRCLALNIYHEARSEPESGQIAVARVTLNRVASDAFPETVCAVVKQGGQTRNRCQFSWWCDGKSDHPTEEQAWRRSLEIGRRVLNEEVPDPTHGALYYHADYVKPSWARSFKRTAEIGRHRFYRPTRA